MPPRVVASQGAATSPHVQAYSHLTLRISSSMGWSDAQQLTVVGAHAGRQRHRRVWLARTTHHPCPLRQEAQDDALSVYLRHANRTRQCPLE